MTSAPPAAVFPGAPGNVEALPRNRILIASVIGNGLILYDFTVYSFSAATIGKLFFPSGSAVHSLLLALATFGAGFLMRPLGALLIGSFADRNGHKAGLLLSIALMTLGTLLIAVVPTYDTIGVTATLLVVISRLLQGLSAGGEIGTASAMMMEMAGPGQRCHVVSWRAASQGAAAIAGALIGAITTLFFSTGTLLAWGRRIPFVLGLPIAAVGWYLRRQATVMPIPGPTRPRLAQLFAQHRSTLWHGILLMAAPSASVYIMVFYLPIYLVQTLHLPAALSLLAACLAGAVIMVATPLMGLLADRQQRRKPIQFLMLTISLILVYPAFSLLTHTVNMGLSLLIICSYAAVALSNGGVNAVLVLEAFPRQHRAAGMSIIYSFGTTLFGGFSPFIVTWLIDATGSAMAPAWYLSAALAISLIALHRFPERRQPE